MLENVLESHLKFVVNSELFFGPSGGRGGGRFGFDFGLDLGSPRAPQKGPKWCPRGPQDGFGAGLPSEAVFDPILDHF